MKFNKKIFLIFLVLTLIAGTIPGIVIGVIIPQLKAEKTDKLTLWSKYKFDINSTNKTVDPTTNKGWDPETLKNQIQEDKNFIVYFGTKQCPACSNLTENIKKNLQLTKALNTKAKKQQKAFLLYLYYTNDSLQGSKRTKMNNDITKIFDDLNFDSWRDKVKSESPFSFPTWFFFKEGKLVEIIDALGTQAFVEKAIEKINEHY